MEREAVLILEDGTRYKGRLFGYEKSVSGELVFYTAMTGYPESLSDPSYKGQILVPTFPLIGNYGVPGDETVNGISKFYESDRIQCSALVISQYSAEYSHWDSEKSLGEWLKKWQVPGIYGIDTRALTKRLREKGAMLGKIIFGDEDIPFYDPNKDNLVAQVSCPEIKHYGNGRYKVLMVDCGMKNNILRCLLQYDVQIKRVPWNYDFSQEDYDGLFISNGPGDPAMCTETIANIRKALSDDRPIMGICLGNQLLALAAGAKTYKLKYGHRGHNQTVRIPGTHKCFVTSQNHGFAIDDSTLPADWERMFENLNDGTNEGIKHKSKPFFSTQFHPEASSGPTDTGNLFGMFVENMINAQSSESHQAGLNGRVVKGEDEVKYSKK